MVAPTYSLVDRLNMFATVNRRPGAAQQVVLALLMLAAVTLIAVLGSMAGQGNTDGWYAEVEKVSWSPPNSVFGPAWSFLYFLIALAGFLLWRKSWEIAATADSESMATAKTLFIIQLVLNGLWTPVFFAGYPHWGEAAWWAALVIIVLLVIVVLCLIFSALRHSKAVGALLVPYVLWLMFATTLNAGIILLN